jgi:hypothetical protein
MILDRGVQQLQGYLRRVCLGALVVLCFSANVEAADRELQRPSVQLDVVLVIDASGSMLKTDPQNLRYQGAKLLQSFLGEGDRLGVVQFASSASLVAALEPYSVSKGRETVGKLESIATEGQFTDIAEGLKLGASTLEANPRPGAQRIIVLLSDGKMEPDPKVAPAFARTLELVHDVLPELKAKETKVFTLSFSEEADRTLLGEISAATDGLTWFTKSADEIHKSFAELFLAVKRPQVVAQTGRGFVVDSDVKEATFYINHGPDEVVQLIDPHGQASSAEKHAEYVTWFTGKNFDVITVSDPDPGTWSIAGTQTQDGFATVMTDLKLLTDWPLTIRAGDVPLVQARLYDREKPVSLPEMSGVLKIGFQIIPTDRVSGAILQESLNDNGVHGDTIAQDGIFSSATVPMSVGTYKLVVVAKGPTFQRSQQIPFTVNPRLVSLEVQTGREAFDESLDGKVKDDVTPLGATEGFSGDEQSKFIVSLSREAAAFKKIEVELLALSAEREKIVVPMKRDGTNSRTFVVEATALPKDGNYKLKAAMKAEVRKGEQISAESPAVSFSLVSTVTRVPVVEHQHSTAEEKDESDKPKDSSPNLPIVPLAVVSLSNAIALVLGLYLLGRKASKSATVAQKYLPHKQLLDAIAGLEERATASVIELGDPILQSFETTVAVSREPSESQSQQIEQTGGGD